MTRRVRAATEVVRTATEAITGDGTSAVMCS
jgi:hypothetical protein